MIIRLVAGSCAVGLLSVSLAAAQTSSQHHETRQPLAVPQSTPITVTGCVVRQSDSSAHPNGSRTPDGGTLARTNEGRAPAGGEESGSANRGPADAPLILIVTHTSATRTVSTSAVPGSIPSGTDSGTVPTQTIVGAATDQASAATAYALAADQHVDLGSHVGQRVEISGMRNEPDGKGENDRVVRQGQDTAGTRSEAPSISPAHPSAELPRITVATVKPLGGACGK